MPITLISRTKVSGDEKSHSAFTDLFKFQDKFYLVFRNGAKHLSPEGKIVVMSSVDAKDWVLVHTFHMGDKDLRDPKLFLWAGKLCCLFVASVRDVFDRQGDLDTFYSVMGEEIPELVSPQCNWSEPELLIPGLVAWRPKHHNGKLYIPAWKHGSEMPGSLKVTEENRGRLISKYGKNWQLWLYTFDASVMDGKASKALLHSGNFVNESEIQFDGKGRAIILARCEFSNGVVFTSEKEPYADWAAMKSNRRLACPAAIALPDGSGTMNSWREVWRETRNPENWDEALMVSLHRGEKYDHRYDECCPLFQEVNIDCGYPGLAWKDEKTLLISYYLGTGLTSNIWVSELKIGGENAETKKEP